MPYYDETDKAASYERAYDHLWARVEQAELDAEIAADRERERDRLDAMARDADEEAAFLDWQVQQAEMSREDLL